MTCSSSERRLLEAQRRHVGGQAAGRGSGSRRPTGRSGAARDRPRGRGSRRPGPARSGCRRWQICSGSVIGGGQAAAAARAACCTTAPQARPVVGRAGLGVLRRPSAGAASRSASSSRWTSGRCRWSRRPRSTAMSLRQPGGPRHQLADAEPGHGGGDRLAGRRGPRRGVGLGVPGLVLRRAAEEEEDDARLRLAEPVGRPAAAWAWRSKRGQRQAPRPRPPTRSHSRRVRPSHRATPGSSMRNMVCPRWAATAGGVQVEGIPILLGCARPDKPSREPGTPLVIVLACRLG